MAVIDIARKKVATGSPDESVAAVVRRMHEDEVSGLVIVEDEQPLGLITHKDLTPVLLEGSFDAENTPINEFLTGEVVTVNANTGLYDALDLFSDEGVRRAPVVEDDGTLAGIISISDVVVLLGMELQHVANTIRSSSPAYERAGTEFYQRE